MDAVIMDASLNARELVFLASDLCEEGFENVILFSHLSERDFFHIQISLFEMGVPAIPLRCNEGAGAGKLLKTIRGNLHGSFLLVYSPSICGYDIEKARKEHRKSGKGATLLLTDSHLAGVYLENEIFDYLEVSSDFERGALVRIFEDDEGAVYHLSSYEMT